MTSFMGFNFKSGNVGLKLYPDEIQNLLTVRRDAHFYDVAFDVVRSAKDIALADDYREFDMIPPTSRGYMRFPIYSEYDPKQGFIMNGLVWDRKMLWILHDNPNEKLLRIMPYKLEIGTDPDEDMKIGAADLRTPEEKEESARTSALAAWRNCQLRPISPEARKDHYYTNKQAISDFLALCAIVFAMIAETKATTVTNESVAHAFAAKHKPFYTKTTVVKIALSKCRNKRLKRDAEPTGRVMPWHEPRAHFAHFRITQPDCAHVWQPRGADDDGKRYKCATCGEWKTRREYPNGRGSRDVGIIQTNYEIVA